ncbi:MAG: hypothetical protein ACUVQ1_07080 [Candidatus Kapaibacteriales bacterium]
MGKLTFLRGSVYCYNPDTDYFELKIAKGGYEAINFKKEELFSKNYVKFDSEIFWNDHDNTLILFISKQTKTEFALVFKKGFLEIL